MTGPRLAGGVGQAREAEPPPQLAAYLERLARGDIDANVGVEIDHAHQLVVFVVRERLAITPTVVGVPFALLDFVHWQRLTEALRAAGVLKL